MSNALAAELIEKIRSKQATVGVVGLGYVGLPLIQAFIKAGLRTIGFDVDQQKVDKLLSGQSDSGHSPSEWISKGIDNGSFTPTADMKRLAEPDAVF